MMAALPRGLKRVPESEPSLAMETSRVDSSGPSGKWKLSYTTPEGPEESTLDVSMASDGSLSGTLFSPRGNAAIISGYLSVDKFSFTINIPIEGSPTDVVFNGTFDGTSIKGSISVQGLEIDFTGTKPGSHRGDLSHGGAQ